jgi:acetyl-CoA carboxylase carboxyl transferase subunit alpha
VGARLASADTRVAHPGLLWRGGAPRAHVCEFSGGALAIGVGDRTIMLEYSTYSVISPEGCASILWKSADKAKDAAEQLGLTAPRLKGLGLVDKVVREPIGGAHRNPAQMAKRLKAVLVNEIDALADIPVADLLDRRYARLRGYGAYEAA